jgi:hypothetical protein
MSLVPQNKLENYMPLLQKGVDYMHLRENAATMD